MIRFLRAVLEESEMANPDRITVKDVVIGMVANVFGAEIETLTEQTKLSTIDPSFVSIDMLDLKGKLEKQFLINLDAWALLLRNDPGKLSGITLGDVVDAVIRILDPQAVLQVD